MQQTLAGLIGNTTAKIKTEVVDKTKQPLTFFEKNRNKVLSGEAARSYAQILALAKAESEHFMNAVHDPSHPDHEKNLIAYDGFGRNQGKVMHSFMSRISADLNSPNPEDLKEDPAYEARMLEQHRPQREKATADDLAFFDILKTTLKKSRDARGYCRDKEHDRQVVLNWISKYGKS